MAVLKYRSWPLRKARCSDRVCSDLNIFPSREKKEDRGRSKPESCIPVSEPEPEPKNHRMSGALPSGSRPGQRGRSHPET